MVRGEREMSCSDCRSATHNKRECPDRWASELKALDLRYQRNPGNTELSKEIYTGAKLLFRGLLRDQNYLGKGIQALLTKFNDAGPRSAPTAAFSKTVAGRPQSGADGNRINRWLLEPGHKQYATECEARLVGTRYILQALSMVGAPSVPMHTIEKSFHWLLGHEIRPGFYLDPVLLIPLVFNEMFENPRMITSGHFVPLSRGNDLHNIRNTFLQSKKSNDLQSDNTLEELLEMISGVLERHTTNH